MSRIYVPEDALNNELKHPGLWDVVVVGTGVGGATVGYELARLGKRVLFLEQGRKYIGDQDALTGRFAETFKEHRGVPTAGDAELMKRAGRYWAPIHDQTTGARRRFIPYIGAGVGGSSALYGAVLERFFPADFKPAGNFEGAHGADLPDAWPFGYETLAPYYDRAERLYRVRGGGDPLRKDLEARHDSPEAELDAPNRELMEFFNAKGFHSYQLPVACERVSGCSGCQGFLCDKECKNDGARICISQALAEFGAELWTECEVLSIEAGQDRVERIQCLHEGKLVNVEANVFVLGAGALATPALLLKSRSQRWPDGVANGSGLVGRMLMRHYVDLYAVFTHSAREGTGAKQLAFNDLYYSREGKFGTVQSFGLLPPSSVLVDTIHDDMDHGLFHGAGWGVEALRPLLEGGLGTVFGRATILASIMEDLPYSENRVFLGKDGELCIDYQIRDYERARIAGFRKLIKDALSPYRFLLIRQAESNQRIAHVCGTCRAGDDPQISVVDRYNRSHELGNLYIVDASFFPSSGGTNPALTIAANALRVAEAISQAKMKDCLS